MDRYLSRKRARSPPTPTCSDEDSTDMKLARLASLFPDMALDALMEILLSSGGCVGTATTTIQAQASLYPPKKRSTAGATPAIQTSLNAHMRISHPQDQKRSLLTRKGKTLHLYAPEDIAAHTPCTIIHNFLPAAQANALLLELLDESKHFSRYRFQLFDRTVQSPHSASIYVATPEQHRQHTAEYTYGGTYRATVRQTTPHLRAVSGTVQQTVNAEIQHRIRTVYPGGRKLKYQSPKEWMPNAAFVNCYDGPTEAVGYHSDELTYLGPRAVIGSLSLGVEREFRVRKIIPTDDDDDAAAAAAAAAEDPEAPGDTSEGQISAHTAADKTSTPTKAPIPSELNNNISRKSPTTSSPAAAAAAATAGARANARGQISIHLPHNSLLVMHAEMQEEWKHAIVPAQTISPHPLAGNRRINVTYRWYRDSLHPRYTPRCRCGAPTILRCVQRRRETRGRYMWMCYAGYAPGKKGCSFFQWADFNEDGEPLWDKTAVPDDAPWLENFVEGQDQLEAGVRGHVGNEKDNTSI
ncbi:GRF zinc finger domain-containing protein [Aspergillus violaceofuscus CBS 115571]|uniref:GRF zinc finger domain-containing protein n=1 Tax=Aspergillus violaceofuscus (strain CBS 115571) TaxID=1450538 RepID=A0A2V5HHG3_ASPV1|nr:GRF zinc finger domain-containing protein [Aspergillus violaceofuscus CBS 115571]